MPIFTKRRSDPLWRKKAISTIFARISILSYKARFNSQRFSEWKIFFQLQFYELWFSFIFLCVHNFALALFTHLNEFGNTASVVVSSRLMCFNTRPNNLISNFPIALMLDLSSNPDGSPDLTLCGITDVIHTFPTHFWWRSSIIAGLSVKF